MVKLDLKIVVTDRQAVESGILIRSAYALISIRDPRKKRVRIPQSPLLKVQLELVFHDAEPTAGIKLPRQIRLMNAQDAASIRDFVMALPNTVKTLVVHCEQGMSRSPAVAAGVCQGLRLDSSEFFRAYQPNGYVLRLVKEAFEQIPES